MGAGYTQSTYFGLIGFLLLTIAATAWGAAAIAGLAVEAFTERRVMATATGAGVAVIGYVLNAVGNHSPGRDALHALSPYHRAYGETPLTEGLDAGGLGLLPARRHHRRPRRRPRTPSPRRHRVNPSATCSLAELRWLCRQREGRALRPGRSGRSSVLYALRRPVWARKGSSP